MFIASASFDAFAITVDLTSAVNGSLSGDQGFYGTQAVEVGVVCPLALSLTGMTLREFSVREDDGSGRDATLSLGTHWSTGNGTHTTD